MALRGHVLLLLLLAYWRPLELFHQLSALVFNSFFTLKNCNMNLLFHYWQWLLDAWSPLSFCCCWFAGESQKRGMALLATLLRSWRKWWRTWLPSSLSLSQTFSTSWSLLWIQISSWIMEYRCVPTGYIEETKAINHRRLAFLFCMWGALYRLTHIFVLYRFTVQTSVLASLSLLSRGPITADSTKDLTLLRLSISAQQTG